ncbi:MAG: RES family NAD+ phosphorylase [Rubrobacteraceae bacterium]
MAKLPEPPPAAAMRGIPPDVEVLPAGTRLYRIYFRGGGHPGGWNQFRDFGPLPSARFDHHFEPPRIQERAILYAAVREDAVATCVAEAFQEGRLVDTRLRDPQLVAFSLVDDVPLLSLRGRWPTRAGASTNINSGPRPRCRRWSRATHKAYPGVSGLLYTSSMNGNRPAVALYERAARALPAAPDLNRPLSDAALLLPLERIASSLGYDLA